MASKKKIDWVAIEGAYRTGVMPLRAIAEKYGCSEGLIRQYAKREGWLQDPEGKKREYVKSLMSGISTQTPTQRVNATLTREAEQDASDMGDSLALARKCISKLSTMVDATDNPKDVKIVAEANKIAMETIRRIRGLDDPTPPPVENVFNVSVRLLTA